MSELVLCGRTILDVLICTNKQCPGLTRGLDCRVQYSTYCMLRPLGVPAGGRTTFVLWCFDQMDV